jgi:hypothetical protein
LKAAKLVEFARIHNISPNRIRSTLKNGKQKASGEEARERQKRGYDLGSWLWLDGRRTDADDDWKSDKVETKRHSLSPLLLRVLDWRQTKTISALTYKRREWIDGGEEEMRTESKWSEEEMKRKQLNYSFDAMRNKNFGERERDSANGSRRIIIKIVLKRQWLLECGKGREGERKREEERERAENLAINPFVALLAARHKFCWRSTGSSASLHTSGRRWLESWIKQSRQGNRCKFACKPERH